MVLEVALYLVSDIGKDEIIRAGGNGHPCGFQATDDLGSVGGQKLERDWYLLPVTVLI